VLTVRTPAANRPLSLRTYGAMERLVGGGYLEWQMETGLIQYGLTNKGRAAWQAYLPSILPEPVRRYSSIAAISDSPL